MFLNVILAVPQGALQIDSQLLNVIRLQGTENVMQNH